MTTGRVNRVVVGITGSLANLAALHVAVAQARRSAAPLVAVHTWVPVGGEIAYRRGPCPQLLSVWRQQARDTLARAFADALGGVPTDLPVECLVLRGEAAATLVAVGQPDDLLVIGSGRRGRLAAFRVGSVSRYCFSHAGCPVLAVPPPAMIQDLGSRRRLGHLRNGVTVEAPVSDRPRR
jgi:nucleotide-binding universal stress UspA family protein